MGDPGGRLSLGKWIRLRAASAGGLATSLLGVGAVAGFSMFAYSMSGMGDPAPGSQQVRRQTDTDSPHAHTRSAHGAAGCA